MSFFSKIKGFFSQAVESVKSFLKPEKVKEQPPEKQKEKKPEPQKIPDFDEQYNNFIQYENPHITSP